MDDTMYVLENTISAPVVRGSQSRGGLMLSAEYPASRKLLRCTLTRWGTSHTVFFIPKETLAFQVAFVQRLVDFRNKFH